MKPLLTLFIAGYNQEKLVGESIASALAQDYEKLEIILSDDASKDSTFHVMQAARHSYIGPHSIVLNQNRQNLGIAAHVQEICRLSKGELIIAMGGDDISRPGRVREIVRMFEYKRKTLDFIHTDYSTFTADVTQAQLQRCASLVRRAPEENIIAHFPGIHGATAAYSRRVWTNFQPFLYPRMPEDRPLAFRSMLMGGGTQHLARDLLLYRVHDNNYSTGIKQNSWTNGAQIVAWNKRWRSVMEQCHDQYDADRIWAAEKGMIDSAASDSLGRAITRARKRHWLTTELELWVWTESSYSLVRLQWEAWRNGLNLSAVARKVVKKLVVRAKGGKQAASAG